MTRYRVSAGKSAAILAATLLAGCATTGGGDSGLRDLSGDWTVDLRPSLQDAPYTQPMELRVARDGAVTGTFYGSDIADGLAGEGQGRSCVAFRTFDNSGPYHTSACLEGDVMVGQTWSEGRGFMLPWTATRD
ncbi:hypothetical protein [Aurantiacibacter gangjinensis]|uniref:Uncharacterized protein n=1 Tax=Aurantiacibacter gangjinensis TaxID=502682 RepID=A0A0G9MVA8_9SPHN|nr:hypothetical protein [Aurantiacibacter gangjinensis]APE29165.1 hypothetical protein BMF35_a2336 [Aurantiacibacter gangjinensis]KLE33233.1 hypothetical protein AAW01_04555 [Aurantiacibacter gangjinensis]